ncbi:MerR family transcriptional regulator [Bacillus infantis]|uniref:MerR family transcriptional regulator n=1 Tax=Bacillus infantis TaxID=324767 RepID=UPI00054F38D3|nr:MerR family transcriptional regulator [Bacillus infantis]
MANVSKRTIDYYTALGLIKAERSKSNYRLYSEDVLLDLTFIEECKKLHIPLEEIKRKLELKKDGKAASGTVEKQILDVTQQIRHLHTEISSLLPLIQKLDGEEKNNISKKLSTEGLALIQSLKTLTS